MRTYYLIDKNSKQIETMRADNIDEATDTMLKWQSIADATFDCVSDHYTLVENNTSCWVVAEFGYVKAAKQSLNEMTGA